MLHVHAQKYLYVYIVQSHASAESVKSARAREVLKTTVTHKNKSGSVHESSDKLETSSALMFVFFRLFFLHRVDSSFNHRFQTKRLVNLQNLRKPLNTLNN